MPPMVSDQPEDHVVYVHAAGRHVPWPPLDLRPDHPGAQADEQERTHHAD
jgi:hypothetical protein